MFAGKNKQLQKIDELRNKGKFIEASDKLAEFEKKNHKLETSIRAQLIKTLITVIMGFWKEGLVILEPVIIECETIGNPLLLIDALIVKALCLSWGEQYIKSNTLIEETEKKLEENLKPDENDYRIRKAWLLWTKGTSFCMMGDNKQFRETAKQSSMIVKSLTDSEILFNNFDLQGMAEFHSYEFEKAIVYFQAGLELAKDCKNDTKIYIFALRLAESYTSIGSFNLASEHCNLAIDHVKKLGWDANWVIKWVLYQKAFVYWFSGEIEKSIKLLKEILPSLENETTLKERAFALVGEAVVEWVEGDLDKTLEYLLEATDLIKKRDDVFRFELIYVTLARVLFDKGEFDQVLEICYSIIDTWKNDQKSINSPSVFYLMGKVYHLKGDYNLALEYEEKALKLFKRFNDSLFIVLTLFTLLQISIDKNDKVLYTKTLKELELFVEHHPTNFFEQIYQTAQALVLKISSRPRDWAKACDILINVVNKKFQKHSFAIIVLINLCEVLMNEFSMSGDAQVLQELELYVEELSELAKKQNVHHLRLEANNLQIMTHWLKAQNSMVELDFQKVKALLENTREIADEKGLHRLAEKLIQQQEKLLVQLSHWDDFIRKYYEFIKE